MPLASVTAHWLAGWGQPEAGGYVPRRIVVPPVRELQRKRGRALVYGNAVIYAAGMASRSGAATQDVRIRDFPLGHTTRRGSACLTPSASMRAHGHVDVLTHLRAEDDDLLLVLAAWR